MIFLTRLKILFRQKGIWFWTFAFPFLLVTFEYLSFGTIKYDSLDTIGITIVSEGENKVDDNILDTLEGLTYSDNTKMYEINKVQSLDIAKEKFDNKEISLYMYTANTDDKKTILMTRESSIAATITQNILGKMSFISETISLAYQQYTEEVNKGNNPETVDPNKIIAELLDTDAIIQDISVDVKSNPSTVYFFALLAMTCIFACFWGNQIITDIRADQSSLGIRVSSSPTNKFVLITNYFLAALLVQTIGNIFIFVYMNYILNINLGNHVFLVLLTMFLGSISGITLGMFISCVVKGNASVKDAFSTMISLMLSFLSGTMSVEVKHLIDKSLPFIKYINPGNLITDSLYSLFCYADFKVYILNSILLIVISIVFLLITIFRIRGEKYASI